MEQYQNMRRSLPEDVVLFFRLGDFYEMFFEDAIRTADVLNVALTKRHDVPMCGVPHHAGQGYIAKLVKAGIRVAIAEQTSIPQTGKLVERQIKHIISAGTVNDITLLDDTKQNYIVGVYHSANAYGLATVDHTTGEFSVAEFPDKASLEDEIHRLSPSELIYADDQAEEFGRLNNAMSYDGYAFMHEQAVHQLCDHFKVKSLDGFGCESMQAASSAAGAVLHYLSFQLRRSCEHLKSLSVLESKDYVLIDSASQRNLDLVDSRSGRKHTLLGVLDKTATPMGARKLRDWILHPLKDLAALTARQDLIEALVNESFVLSNVKDSLKGIKDIERTTGRLSQGGGNPRDIVSLASSLAKIPDLKEDVRAIVGKSKLASQLLAEMEDFSDLVDLVQSAIVDEPPAQLRDGGVIRDGFNADLDELRSASTEGKNWIAKLQQEEREKSGIDNLKIKYNNVFGYFIEISKGKVDQVPERYQRKQTMANAERYITPELKEIESKVLGAEERSKQIEFDTFIGLRDTISQSVTQLQKTASALAALDVMVGLAELAQLYSHSRPKLDMSKDLVVVNGRHPVLEQTLVDEKFVPNDTKLFFDDSRLVLLTGPNMAGKSTYIRQVALITLMAQVGAFVPAESAQIGLVDRIFCRVGASDDLTKGQSTFMVEMNETSLIINNATERSLVILDEIGRGTATFDGLSIAWSVAEHLHDEVKSRTLFATHYHELTALSTSRKAVENYNVAVREWNEEIIFLRKIIPGTADKSYGIQVARLAGLPSNIINRAKAILAHLEANASKPETEETAKKNQSDTEPKTKVETKTKAKSEVPNNLLRENETPLDLPEVNKIQMDLF